MTDQSSINSSNLLSEETISDDENPTDANLPSQNSFFHEYLDELAASDNEEEVVETLYDLPMSASDEFLSFDPSKEDTVNVGEHDNLESSKELDQEEPNNLWSGTNEREDEYDKHEDEMILDQTGMQPDDVNQPGGSTYSPTKTIPAQSKAFIPESPSSTLGSRSIAPTNKRVRLSPMKHVIPYLVPITPPKHPSTNKIVKNISSSTSTNILSPFSPKARKLRLQSSQSGVLSTASSDLKFSMTPSRKVSFLVNISPHLNALVSDHDENTLCLYPNVADEAYISSSTTYASSPQRSIKSTYSVSTQTSILNKAVPAQEVLLVNPDAFGNLIPTSVTLETARVVALANKCSEDWVRKFRFDEVCWPDVKQLIGINKTNTNKTMEDISKAVVSDMMEGKNAVILGYGVKNSGRLESMFGSFAGDFGNLDDSTLGFFGMLVSKLLDRKSLEDKSIQPGSKDGMTFTLSFLEILQEDVLSDLLVSIDDEKPLKIRHPDSKGAIVQNLLEITPASMTDMKSTIRKVFHGKRNRNARFQAGGRGHIVVTVKLYPKGITGSENYTLVQLVDLACAETDMIDSNAQISGKTKLELKKTQDRRSSMIRTSLSGLGPILRSYIIQDAHPNPVSYRSCTLTKLLQRSIESKESRITMISTVCPRRESYKRTLHTLTFMHRLLVRPDSTAESPFDPKAFDHSGLSPSISHILSPIGGDHSISGHSIAHTVADTVASEVILHEFQEANANSEFLKSLVRDPRQRLATLISQKSPTTASCSSGGVPSHVITTIEEVESSDLLFQKNFMGIEEDHAYIEGHNNISFSSSAPDANPNMDTLDLTDDFALEGSTFYDNSNVLYSAHKITERKDVAFDNILHQVDETDTSPKLISVGNEGHLNDEGIYSGPSLNLENSVDNLKDDSLIKEVLSDVYRLEPQENMSDPIWVDSLKPDPEGVHAQNLEDESRSKSSHMDASNSMHYENRVQNIEEDVLTSDFQASEVSTLTPYNISPSNNIGNALEGSDVSDDSSLGDVSAAASYSMDEKYRIDHGLRHESESEESYPVLTNHHRKDIETTRDTHQGIVSEGSKNIIRSVMVDVEEDSNENIVSEEALKFTPKSIIERARETISQTNSESKLLESNKNDRGSSEKYETFLRDALGVLDNQMEMSPLGNVDLSLLNSPMKKDTLYPASDDSDEVESLDGKKLIHEDLEINRVEHLQSELRKLQNIILSVINSTNEQKLIRELVDDKIELDHPFGDQTKIESIDHQSESLIKSIRQMSSQTEALQLFVSSTMEQLDEARRREIKIRETMEETETSMKEDIEFIKKSNRVSIDQMRKEYESALKEAAKRDDQEISILRKKLDILENENISGKSKILQDEIDAIRLSKDEVLHSNQLLQSQVDTLREEIKNHKDDLRKKQNSIDAISKSKRDMELRIKEDDISYQVATEEIVRLKAKLGQVETENEKELSLLQRKIDSLQHTIQSNEDVVFDLESKVKKLKREEEDVIRNFNCIKESLERENLHLKDQKRRDDVDRAEWESNQKRAVDDLRTMLSVKESSLNDLENLLSQVRKEFKLKFEEKESRVIYLESENERLSNLTSSLTRRESDIQETLDRKGKEIFNLQELLQSSAHTREQLVREYDQNIASLKSELNRLSDHLQKIESENRDLQDTLFIATNEYSKKEVELQTVNASLKKEVEHLSNNLRNHQRNADDMYSELKHEIYHLTQEKESLLLSVDSLKQYHNTAIKQAEAKCDDLNAKLMKDISDMESKLQERSSTISKLTSELESVKDIQDYKLKEAQSVQSKLEVSLSLVQSDIAERQRRLNDIQYRLDSLQKDYDNLLRYAVIEKVEVRNVISHLNDQIALKDKEICDLVDASVSLKKSLKDVVEKTEKSKLEFEDKLKAEVSPLNEQLLQKEESIDSLNRQLESQKNQFEDLLKNTNDDVYHLTKKVDDARAQLEEKDQKVHSLVQDIDALTLDLEKKNIEISFLYDDLTSIKDETSRIMNQKDSFLEELRMKLKSSEQSQEDIEKKLVIVMDDLKNANEVIENLTDELNNEKSKRLHDRTAHAMEMSKLHDTAETIRQEKENEIEICRNEIYSLKNQLDILSDTRNSLQSELNELGSAFNRTVSDKSECDRKIKYLEETLSSFRSRLEDSEKSHEDRVTKLASIIDDKTQDMERLSNECSEQREEINQLYQSLKEEIESKISTEKQHRDQIDALEKTIVEREVAFDDISKRLFEQFEENQRLGDAIALEKSLRIEAEESIKVLSEDIERLTEEKGRIEDEIQVLSEDVKNNDIRCKSLQILNEDAISAKKESDDVHKKEIVVLQEMLQESNLHSSEKEHQIEFLKSELDRIYSDLSKEHSRVTILENKQKNSDEYSASLEKVILDLKKELANLARAESSQISLLKQMIDEKELQKDELSVLLAQEKESRIKSTRELKKALQEAEQIKEALQDQVNVLADKISTSKEDYEVQLKRLSDRESSLSSKLSDLLLVNDTLRNESNNLYNKLADERERKLELQQKNKSLKITMSDNERQLRSQISDLEVAMNAHISKVESQRKKSLEEERSKFRREIKGIEQENEGFKMKIIKLESTIRTLHQRLEGAAHEGNSLYSNRYHNEDFESMKAENERLRRRIRIMEHAESKGSEIVQHDFSGERDDNTRIRKDIQTHSNFMDQCQVERERRIKAEEFAAAMAARAKAGFEERNEEIIQLRMKISMLEAAKENIDRNIPILTDGNLDSDTSVLKERNEALKEVNKYKALARK